MAFGGDSRSNRAVYVIVDGLRATRAWAACRVGLPECSDRKTTPIGDITVFRSNLRIADDTSHKAVYGPRRAVEESRAVTVDIPT